MRALQQLTRHLLQPPPSESDALLLAQLAGRQTDPALRVLMQRYGGLVLGVAQRVLRDAHLAEDAYQATFLLLVRKAGTVRHSLPAWLHRVALRLSLRMKARLKPTVELPDTPATQRTHPVEQADVLGVIDEEIARLPIRLRAVVQWCYLNDASTAHAVAPVTPFAVSVFVPASTPLATRVNPLPPPTVSVAVYVTPPASTAVVSLTPVYPVVVAEYPPVLDSFTP